MSTEAITRTGNLTSKRSSVPDRDQPGFTARLAGDAVLACVGQLDPATNPALRRSLKRVLRLAPDRVVVDLSRVSFFDAGAIGELVRARKTSRAAGGDLVVRAPSPFGRRVLGIVGLTNLIAKEPRGETKTSDAPAIVGAYVAEVVDAYVAELVAAAHLLEDRARVRGNLDQVGASLPPTRALAEPTVELTGRFTDANRSSIVIDEAKGLIAEHFDISIDEATTRLRAFSTAQHQTMHTAAVALMDRTIAVARLAPHRPGQPAAAGGDTEQGALDRAPSRGR